MSDHILRQLALPFHPKHISWLPGATTKDKAKCLAMAYADLRAYQNRLDEICGINWSVSYLPWGERIICHLTINGVTRSSTGESDTSDGNAGTSAEAQAFKRACTMFGLGRYLYELPSVWVEYNADRKAIADAGKAQLDGRYATYYQKILAKAAEAEGPQGADAPTMEGA